MFGVGWVKNGTHDLLCEVYLVCRSDREKIRPVSIPYEFTNSKSLKCKFDPEAICCLVQLFHPFFGKTSTL